MRLPNLLATRRGRLAAFFMLYVTEGVPLGFAAIAVATQLRRMGVGNADVGAFVASFYLPWAFKWAFGPFIDVFRSKLLGHYRGWIIGAQLVMAATVLALLWVPLPQGLWLFTTVLLVHNSFGAIQDVAIDALACNTLSENERGLANGLMFAGASIGTAVGGSAVLWLSEHFGFSSGIVFVALLILSVTGLIALPMKEALIERAAGSAAGLRAAGAEMKKFAVDSFRSFIGTRGAFSGVFFALLPAGAMSLGLALQTNLAVEMGMSDGDVGTLSFWSNVVAAAFMVIGGHWSDKFGRRRTLALYLLGMSPPVIYLMWVLQQNGYVMPHAPGSAPVAPLLITALWIGSIWYAVFQGLMYGTRSAIFMDVTNPRVAATQFTAYMAMNNLAIAIAATWQGIAVEAWGYPVTLLIDAITGPLCCLLLPMLKRDAGGGFSDALAVGRARKSALVLGICCLLWLPCWTWRGMMGSALPMVNSFYTVVFIASALFLLAGREVLGASAGIWRRASLWIVIPLFALYARYWFDKIDAGSGWRTVAEAAIYLVPLIAGLVLLGLAKQNWKALDETEAEAAAA